MLRCATVRTTITIDEQLYRDAKALAAQSSQTVSQVIEDALRTALQATELPSVDLGALPTFGRGGLRSGVDLSDRSATRDLMDDGERLDALR